VDGPWARYVECGDVSPPSKGATRRAGQSADTSAHSKIGLARYPRLVPNDADCAAKLKDRSLTKLYNERPAWLDLAHKKLDIAVARAYGWNDFADILEHTHVGNYYDFEEGNWMLLDTDAKGLAEAHEKFEKESAEKILEKLLALNLERAAEEAKAAKVKKPKTTRGKTPMK
jgi:hypothetical protein